MPKTANVGVGSELGGRQGRYIALDAAETLQETLVGGRHDAARFAEVVGSLIATVAAGPGGEPRRIAAFGEMVALLWVDGANLMPAIRLEQLWNDWRAFIAPHSAARTRSPVFIVRNTASYCLRSVLNIPI